MTDFEIAAVAPHGGSFFMEELLRVVVDAVRRAGGQALLHRGNALHEGWPDGHRRVALVIPHEFGALTRGDEQPPAT